MAEPIRKEPQGLCGSFVFELAMSVGLKDMVHAVYLNFYGVVYTVSVTVARAEV